MDSKTAREQPMILISDCELGGVVDEYMKAIALRGISKGSLKECTIQITIDPDEQDIILGLDGVYLDFGGIGDYGIVRSISIANRSELRLNIDAEGARSRGVELQD